MARFKTLRMLDANAQIPQDFDLKGYFGNAWAVYRGERSYDVEILFAKEAAGTVTEGIWHHTQKVRKNNTPDDLCKAPESTRLFVFRSNLWPGPFCKGFGAKMIQLLKNEWSYFVHVYWTRNGHGCGSFAVPLFHPSNRVGGCALIQLQLNAARRHRVL